jgi:hypothetical protein
MDEGSLAAAYHETLEGGLERLARTDAALALIPFPLFREMGEQLHATPHLVAVRPKSGSREVWSLAARRGSLDSPASLAGWEVTGQPGYAPRFVKEMALARWGALPDSARVTFTPRVVGALRRAAEGEKVAVLLDTAQAEALPSLPFAADLEIVTRSEPLPASLLCSLEDRLTPEEREVLLAGFAALHKSEAGRQVLETMLLERFSPAEPGDFESSPGTGTAAVGDQE